MIHDWWLRGRVRLVAALGGRLGGRMAFAREKKK
jgi:hypothetical protein